MTFTLSKADKELLVAIITMDTDNFGELVKTAGLDPARDFRHADLRDSDFTETDLRGFDFTGSDLRGSTGNGAVWDETTILTDANISGSIFEAMQ